MKLYQFAALFHPSDDERKEEKKKDEIVVALKTVLAPNDQAAALMCGREIPQEYMDKLHQIEVLVRPFA
jgi:hypothetical protein